ncbi:MAG TPA: NUDIX domain-containing protein [Bacteriovoracaceae bacterium]|nr:NUDIX domain-containing protein [Bacteriovoracaceae bacterium]
MEKITKKAQVVIVASDPEHQSFSFLLLKTNEKRGSFWQNVTGKLEDNETYEEGGLREAIEETNLKVEAIIDVLSLGLRYDFTDQRNRNVHEESFMIIMESKWEVKIDPHEHQDFKWVSIEDLRENVVKHNSNHETLKKAKSLLGKWGK